MKLMITIAKENPKSMTERRISSIEADRAFTAVSMIGIIQRIIKTLASAASISLNTHAVGPAGPGGIQDSKNEIRPLNREQMFRGSLN
jgi:hypothetical protein